jgi:molybdopterin synthase sulfur carrier subunit
MKLLYFAWVRTRLGKEGEILAKPEGVSDVRGLLVWLATLGPGYAAAFARPRVIRAAINHAYVKPDHPIAEEDEIALFPPVTGG